MRRFFMAVLLGATALSAVALAQAPAPTPAPASPAATPPAANGAATPAADPVVARVNGLTINRSDVEQMRENLPPQYQQVPFDVLFPIILDRLIDLKLMSVAGRAQNLGSDAEVRSRIAAYEDRVIGDVYMQRAISSAISDDAVRARIEQLQRQTPGVTQIHARHILVAQEQQARDIIAELGRGGDFAAIARERSIDPGGRQDGGDLGWFGEGDMVPEFYAAATRIADGQTSSEPVHTQFGWHVIKVEGRRTQTASPESLRERVVSDMTQEAIDGLVRQLRQGAQIERFNADGSPRQPAPLQMVPQDQQPVAPSGPARSTR
jgi:peptidyl-prolyl cis-trans isomerase C